MNDAKQPVRERLKRNNETNEERIDREFEAMGRDEIRRREVMEMEAFWAPLSDEALRIHLREIGEEGGY